MYKDYGHADRASFGLVLVTLDGSALDMHALQRDGLPPVEIDISRVQIVQPPVIAPAFSFFGESLNLVEQRANRAQMI